MGVMGLWLGDDVMYCFSSEVLTGVEILDMVLECSVHCHAVNR